MSKGKNRKKNYGKFSKVVKQLARKMGKGKPYEIISCPEIWSKITMNGILFCDTCRGNHTNLIRVFLWIENNTQPYYRFDVIMIALNLTSCQFFYIDLTSTHSFAFIRTNFLLHFIILYLIFPSAYAIKSILLWKSVYNWKFQSFPFQNPIPYGRWRVKFHRF